MSKYKTQQEALAALREPIDEFKFRVQSSKEHSTVFVAYIDARAAQQRLDDVFGANWSSEFIVRETETGKRTFCRIHVNDVELGINSFREDTGTESNTEKEKGEISDSFKRAAVNWGVGRFLYSLGMVKSKSIKKGAKFVPSVDGKTELASWDTEQYCNFYLLAAANFDQKIVQSEWAKDKGKSYIAKKGKKPVSSSVKKEVSQQKPKAQEEKQEKKVSPNSKAIEELKKLKKTLLTYEGIEESQLNDVSNKVLQNKSLEESDLRSLTILSGIFSNLELLKGIEDIKNELGESGFDQFRKRSLDIFGSENIPTEVTSANIGLKSSLKPKLVELLNDMQKESAKLN